MKSILRVAIGTAIASVVLLLIMWIAVARPVFVKSTDTPTQPSASLHLALELHVRTLSEEITNRNWKNPEQLNKAADYIRNQWEGMGLTVEEQPFEVKGKTYKNVIVRFPSTQVSNSQTSKKGKIIVGAHYDVAHDLPGADDNASGTAGLIELAKLLKDKPLSQGVDLVAYTLEEPPFFRTEKMGSFIHAQSENQKGNKIDLMLSIEMIGYYSDEPNSQAFPLKPLSLFYPNRGNFIGVVDKLSSKRATEVKKAMRQSTDLPVHSINGPEALPGINFSDHLNYWHFGYDAVMITDTSFYRNTTYHTKDDTADRLNYDNMAKVVTAVADYVAR